MFKLKRFLRPYMKETIVGSGAKLFEAILELLLPLFMGKIIDIGIKNGDIPYVWKTAIIMLGIISVGLASASLCQYYASYTCQNLGNDLRKELMRKISTLSYADIDKFGNATLINRVTNDVNQVVQAVAMLIRLVSRAPFLCIGALVMSIYINPKLSLIFAVLIPIFILIVVIIMTRTIPLYKDTQGKLDKLGSVLRENLSGVRVIRAFARHKNEKKRMDEATEELSKAYIRVTSLSALMNPITSLVMNMGIIIIFYLGAINVNKGTLSQGDIVVLINYITQVLLALIIVANLVVLFTKAAASASRINEILECEPSIIDGAINTTEDNTDDSIVFDNVSFKYNEEDTLSDISFTIKKGEVFGIVGTTGSGKSTIANLICRFYDTTTGNILFRGTNVKKLSQGYLHKEIGIVPQKSVLFSGTIADNIRWGKEDATDEEVIEALKAAEAYDFVSNMENGINSMIYEGGKNFSGGQKQRLTIARALVKKPPVIIMDDSLSALDYATDKKLRNSLKETLKDSTIIIISQRISSIVSSDKILVLDDGKVMGLGTHEELLNNCETYKEIYMSQSK
ncbi:ABC transporter, ATP-binding/permease protein [Clostridium bornimense]|uniref:ABC transporter, ATP-binding/permease protein n=1 Tax=Clostridium bornimense TaxID=1216932 RepID=W6RZB6_9CLOT|nr:ABC transporter ATP-binding protein [Clostridium bornimense]CDM69823.1 ABC transporter, ATP-binding/permease protein [Clostridium bornimense]